MSPRTILRTSQSVNPAKAYWPLSFVVELGTAELDPFVSGVLDDGELVPVEGELIGDEGVSVELLAGGVPDDVEVESDDAGGMLDELDDVEPVLGLSDGVVDEDDGDELGGDGVTTGGVVGAVVADSRLQPATLNTSPVQNNVTKAVFMLDLQRG